MLTSEVSMSHSISELNLNTSSIVNRAKEQDIILTNHRKPVAVILSYERYQEILGKAEGSAKARTLADLRSKLTLVDEFHLPERPKTIHKDIDF